MVYNGYRKINAENLMFMTRSRILECIDSLKLKNMEGYDRIPQRIRIDGHDILIEPLTGFFELVYKDQSMPGQWLIFLIVIKT